MNKYTCAFCGKEHEGYGNSCWPIFVNEDTRCCDKCNFEVVIPMRIKCMQQNKIIEDNQLENGECY